MIVGDRVMFASIDLAESLGVYQDAVCLVTRVYEQLAEADRVDVLFPGSNTLIDCCRSEFVEMNVLN